jgi:hypothetical protein
MTSFAAVAAACFAGLVLAHVGLAAALHYLGGL